MPARAVKERLAQDVGLWQADGVVSQRTADVLRQRYDAPGFGWGTLVRYLGIGGGILALFGILGLVGALAGSVLFGALLLGGVAAGFLYLGVRMTSDPLARSPHASKIILTLGMTLLAAACSLLVTAVHVDGAAAVVTVGAMVLPVGFALAYWRSITFLLVLGLIGLFHWIGSWTSMLDRSTYAVEIQDPRVMAVAALLAVGVGLVHERQPYSRWPRFHHAYEAVGLTYLNLSLLILSIAHPRTAAAWVLVLTLAAVGQIVAGARLQNGLLTGFGVTAFAVDLFTRFHERFWSALDKGTFFFLGGLLLFAFGVGLEVLLRAFGSSGAVPGGTEEPAEEP